MAFPVVYIHFYRLWAPLAIACAVIAFAIVLATFTWIVCRIAVDAYYSTSAERRASTPPLPIPPPRSQRTREQRLAIEQQNEGDNPRFAARHNAARGRRPQAPRRNNESEAVVNNRRRRVEATRPAAPPYRRNARRTEPRMAFCVPCGEWVVDADHAPHHRRTPPPRY